MSLSSSTLETTRRVGANVRNARVLAGISQEKLGAKLGITFQQVQKYEKGTNRIAVATFEKIAGILEVSTISLLGNGHPDLQADEPKLLTAEGVRLLRSFARIGDQKQRARLVGLVESMAETLPQGGVS